MAAAFVVPGRLASRTGGYIYDSRIIDGLRSRGRSVDVLELPDRFPFPDAETLATASHALTRIPNGTITLVDGLAFGAMPQVVTTAATRLRFVPVVHLPLAPGV